MKKIHKATLAAVGVGVLGLGFLAGVWTGCTLPVLSIADGASAAPGKGSGTDITGEVDIPAGSETGKITFTLPWAASTGGAGNSVAGAGASTGSAAGSRSLAGVTVEDIKVGTRFRNIYQLVAVDDGKLGEVWQFAEARDGTGTLSVNILKGHTYHFLFLGGHQERDWSVYNGTGGHAWGVGNGLNADGTIAYTGPPTLLTSGYLKAAMALDTETNKLPVTMIPLVADTAFVKHPGGEVRQSGRMAKTVGLDENSSYIFRVTLGSRETGATGIPDDALKKAEGNGIADLVNAESGVKGGLTYWGDLSLVSNTAWFDTAPLGDFHDMNKTPDSTGTHTAQSTGVAEYLLTTPAANPATVSAYFKMEYAPFGLGGIAAWAGAADFSKPFSPPSIAAGLPGSTIPTWVIRNGLNDKVQNTLTDFALWTDPADSSNKDFGVDLGFYPSPPTLTAEQKTHPWTYTDTYDGLLYLWDVANQEWVPVSWTEGANVNGALSVGMVNPTAAPHPYGIFEDNNPWPIAGTEWTSDKPDNYLDIWLDIERMRDALKTGRGKYGVYKLYDKGTPEGEIIVSGGRAVTSVLLEPHSLTLLVGTTGTLTATVAPSSAANKAVIWYSSNQDIAFVSQDGEVTARADGEAVIEVRTVDGNKTATCTVIVTSTPVAATGVSLNKGTTTVLVGKTETLVATVAPLNATNKAVAWSSSAPAIAEISQSGGVLGKAEGEATITVTTANGKTATCTVTVVLTAVPVTGVSLNPGAASILAGNTETLVATVAPTNATNQNVTWYSSNTNVASVSPGGAVTGIAAGTATIEVRTVDGNKTATCVVTVPSITVSPASAGVQKGGSQQFTAAVSGISDPAVSWTIVETTVKPGTAITSAGLLKVATGETLPSLTVKATSTVAGYTNVFGTATVTVSSDGSGTAGGEEPEF